VISNYVKCDGSLGQAGLFGDMFGAFNAFFTGLAFLAIVITLWLQSNEKRNDELRKYSNCLFTTKNELDFYRTKFQQLSNEISGTVTAAQNGRTIVIPTYRFYPSYLENQKIELSQFHFNSDLIKDTGHCHFELCHILDRLNLYVSELKSINQNNANIVLGNAMGFKALLDSNIITFAEVIGRFDAEINKIKSKIA
jgi:hypothetical protein